MNTKQICPASSQTQDKMLKTEEVPASVLAIEAASFSCWTWPFVAYGIHHQYLETGSSIGLSDPSCFDK